MAEVPRQRTPVSMEALAPLVASGLQARIGAVPARELALLVLAQIAQENGNGDAVIDFDIGNLAAGGFKDGTDHVYWHGDYWRPEWFSEADIAAITDPARRAKHERLHADMLAGKNAVPSAFRAYDSLDKGLGGYLDLLFQPLYHPLLVAGASGDALAFATEIKRHYNADGAPPEPLAHTLWSLAQGFEQKGLFASLPKGVALPAALRPPLPSSPSGLSPSDVVHAPAGRAVLFVLRRGATGPLVSLLEKLLGLPQTGVFDAKTESAVKTFQATRGLRPVDGIVGRLTWTEILQSPMPEKTP